MADRAAGEPGALIPLATTANLRDLGGWSTENSATVRRGILFRSTELSKADDADLAAIGRLGIRTIFDLRTADERAVQPDRAPAGAAEIVCDVLADSADTAPAQLLQLMDDPTGAEEMLGDGKGVRMFERAYVEIVSLPSALAAYRLMFTELLDPDRRPALFHCTTGKDRTGWAAAATLLLLGVPEREVRAEYLITNRDLLPALKPYFDRFAAAGGDPELIRPVLGVEDGYLDAALAEMRERFGTIDAYFTDGLGIGPDQQQELRALLLAERGEDAG